MNDLDAVTFAAFARRFARIEQWVPDQAQAGFAPPSERRPGLRAIGRLAALLGVVLLLGAALAIFSLGSWPAPIASPSPAPTSALTLPPDSANPEVVLAAYLGALTAGQCDVAAQYIDSPIYRWNEILCGGAVGITEFSLVGEPRIDGLNRLSMDALLTTNGRSFGMPADQGRFTFDLQQRSSGAWRIIDAYPWPITLFPTRPPT